jgi:hypothetical protein|tara:strand:- start:84 stop:707 length:624 start_codon:yes stop_codon:yes gene_type:complete
MFKEIKKFLDKIEPSIFLILSLILFLIISYVIFIFFRNARVFENNLWNSILLIIFYSGIYFFLIRLYYKIFKFTLIKPSITDKEFKKLWKKRRIVSQELKKGMENKKIPHGSKKFKEKYGKFKKIGKILDEKTVSFKDWLTFFIFSLYFGLYIGNFFWAIKNSTKYFKEATKKFFSFKEMGLGFKWHKLKNEQYRIDSFIYPHRKPK